MADVITRFKLETTQYDSKLRDAAKGLQAYGKQIETAGKDFTNFSQKAVEAARSLGTIASGANNTKDKLRDLVGAYNDVAKTYNKLTEQQRQTDFGKAMSQSLEQLQVRIKETKDELYGLSDAVKGKGGGLFGEDGMTGALQVFGGNMLTKGVEMLTSELADAWSQSIELAKAGEGVRIAFERLNQPGLLEKLKEATHGTVSEVELMKQAIQFENFKLPLEDLATYLAFAQQKAKDTGQSIDYLVNSIVTGLGRQSKQILDNLGISASELTRRMNEGADMTKAVADIIREEMAKAGDYVETAADRAARATADAQNQMEEFGRSAAPLAEAFTSMWNDIKNGALDVANTLLGPLANSILSIQNILNTTLDDRRIQMFDAFDKLSKQQQAEANKKKPTWGDVPVVTAPGGYVEITDKNTGAVIGGKHFDNLNDKNAIKDWQKTLTKTNSGNKSTKTVKTEEQLNNETIQKLTQEYIKASDSRQDAIRKEIKTLQDRNKTIQMMRDEAQGNIAPDGSLKALNAELAELNKQRELLTDPIEIEIIDNQIQDIKDEIDQLNGKKVEIELAVDNRTPFEQLKDSLKIEIAEENMQVDTTTLQTLMKTAIQNGINGLDPQFASLQEKMREGMNIPDSAWEDLQTQINEKLKELGIKPIKIDFTTGNIAKAGKETEKSWQAAAQAVQTVGSAMSSIEDPAAKVAGTVMQAVASIALGYAQATTQAASLGPWAWVAFAATGLATMLSTISSIHSATGYSEGGMIKGNSYSGDLIPANGGMIGLNAGEVVLNRAQQNTLASELQGSGGGSDRYMPSFVSGEQIWIALNAYTKRTGRGELVTWR